MCPSASSPLTSSFSSIPSAFFKFSSSICVSRSMPPSSANLVSSFSTSFCNFLSSSSNVTWLTSSGVVLSGSVPLAFSNWAETVDGGGGVGNGSSSSSFASSFSSRWSSASNEGSLLLSLSVRAAGDAAGAVAAASSPVSSDTSASSDSIPLIPLPISAIPSGPFSDVSLSAVKSQ